EGKPLNSINADEISKRASVKIEDSELKALTPANVINRRSGTKPANLLADIKRIESEIHTTSVFIKQKRKLLQKAEALLIGNY
ncbi:MAG: hypothetical protein QXP42_06080, partial [Candidatus Micrarchaeia archaeon]